MKLIVRKLMAFAIAVGVAMLVGLHLTRDDADVLGLKATPVVVAYWLFVPAVVILFGLVTSNIRRLQQATFVLGYWFAFMSFNVFHTFKQDVMGAEQFHVFVAPIVMASGMPIVIYIEWCVWRIRAWIGAR